MLHFHPRKVDGVEARCLRQLVSGELERFVDSAPLDQRRSAENDGGCALSRIRRGRLDERLEDIGVIVAQIPMEITVEVPLPLA